MQEFGIYSPSKGYLQVVGGELNPSDYGDDYIPVPLKPSQHHIWNGVIWEFVAPVPPTHEELRQKMPKLSMVDFRRKLRGIRTETVTDGIYEEDILEKIDIIADKDLAAEARDYFLYAQYIERINPWVEILGSMFGLTPEDIDVLWVGDNES